MGDQPDEVRERRAHADLRKRKPAPEASVPVKIALLSFEYPPETGFGGIGTYTWYQARALAKLGHEVHVLAGSKEEARLHSEERDGVTVFRNRARGALMRSANRLGKYRMWWTRNRIENALSMVRGLKQLLREHTYDLIEMPECGAEGLFVNRLRGVKTLVKLHSPAQMIMPLYDVTAADVRWCSFLERTAMRSATAYSSCSRFLVDEARERLGLERPIEVIPNGIDVELFDTAGETGFRRRFDLDDGRPMILFSGRLERRKGIHLCGEIVSKTLAQRSATFVFAGDDLFDYWKGTLLPGWETQKLQGSVRHLGRLSLDEIRSGLRESDIFLLPSLWENCPYSCLEAMAAGCAIVASDQGGVPELIRHGENGLLARCGDAADFASCLVRLLDDADLRRKLGAAARRTIEQSFSDVQIGRQSVEYYRRCIA